MWSKWNDRINPVLLKELRQSLHNRWPVGIMGLMLAGLWIVLLIFQVNANSYYNNGGEFFVSMVSLATGIAGAVVCVLIPMSRFCGERENPELDFARITTLSPDALVRGKLMSSAVMTLFIFALVMPFMVIAYFLRGVSLVQIALIMLGIGGSLVLMSAMGLALGSCGKRKLCNFLAAYLMLQSFYGMVISLVMLAMRGVSERTITAVSFGLGLLALYFFYVVTVAAVSPVYSNRLRTYRILLLVAGLALPWILALTVPKDFTGALLIAGFIAVIAPVLFERLEPGERVLRKCPKGLWGRLFYFITSSGAYGGVILAALLMANFYAAYLICGVPWEYAVRICSYVLGGTALVLFLRRWVKKSAKWHVFLVLIILFVPVAILQGELWKECYCEIFAAATILLLLPWIIKAFRTMKRGAEIPVAVPEKAAPAVEEKPEEFKKRHEWFTGEKWSAWSSKILRQGIHSRVFVYGLIGVIALDMLTAFDCFRWHSWKPTDIAPGLFFLPLIVGAGACGSSIPHGVMLMPISRIQENRTHFKDFSVFRPGEAVSGFLLSYTFFFVLLLLAALPGYWVMWQVFTGRHGEIMWSVLFAYAIPLLVGTGAGCAKIPRWDFIIGGISSVFILFYDSNSRPLNLEYKAFCIAVLAGYFILTWCGGLEDRPHRRELLPRIGQLILLSSAWCIVKVCPKHEWLGLVLVCVALCGSVYSAGSGSLWNTARRQYEACRHPVMTLLGSSASPLGWLWSGLIAVVYIMSFFDEKDNDNTFMLVAGLMVWCGGALISGVMEFTYDKKKCGNRKLYSVDRFALLELIVPVALMLVVLLLSIADDAKNLYMDFYIVILTVGGIGTLGAVIPQLLRYLRREEKQ